ncbi:hypothetical protein EYZ11_007919 [Aspergillus tanneri]|uniref:Uncharacterized protein n=1 Tax=Aspergillus tanneri TaxID=1220188 RepID=A0A4S3JBQ6_9EURO|nr:uncharacterized protein ATNIH1004_009036 [Aspergillus tanneri]KAA8644828.1 hypothetical protein ATNIH1004_009036 [Aspergillus tanneri]THC92589.1 hypothetical protein EYZ11_007919 [Aspergillus tanneri]
MTYSLRDRNVLVTAGSRGLGALVAQKFAAEGCNVAINYISSKDVAEKLASELQTQYKVKAITIQGDASLQKDCANAVKTIIEQFGGLDIIVSNAGWTKITRFADLDATNEEDWDRCWSTNVKGNLHLFKEALPTFNANPEGGVFLMTSSTAGNKVRVNAVLPGLLLTEWGQRFPPEIVELYKQKTVLNRVVDLEDTANAYIMLAKNSSMTGQSIQIDAGLVIK